MRGTQQFDVIGWWQGGGNTDARGNGRVSADVPELPSRLARQGRNDGTSRRGAVGGRTCVWLLL